MWHPYGEPTSDSITPVALDSQAPAGSKANIQLLLLMPHWNNTGRIYILSSKTALVLQGNSANVLAWLPPPAPSGIPPFIKLAIGILPAQYFLLSEVPGEGAIVSAYVA